MSVSATSAEQGGDLDHGELVCHRSALKDVYTERKREGETERGRGERERKRKRERERVEGQRAIH